MNKLIASFALVLLTLFSISCKKETKKEDSQSQMEEVMAIHDEVMPKMSTISELVGELKPKIDSTEQGLKYKSAMNDLQNSHKLMMDWMQGFGNRFDSDEILNGKALTEQKQVWLNEEEVKVEELRNYINTSIANAEMLLKK